MSPCASRTEAIYQVLYRTVSFPRFTGQVGRGDHAAAAAGMVVSLSMGLTLPMLKWRRGLYQASIHSKTAGASWRRVSIAGCRAVHAAASTRSSRPWRRRTLAD